MKLTKFSRVAAISLALLLAFILTFTMAGAAFGKSLYVIANLNTSPTPVNAYDIQPDGTIVFQATNNVPYYSGGGVGIAIDTDSKFLFVVYEFSTVIEIIDATTMQSAGTTTMPMASVRAAGVVYDHKNKRLYTAERNSPKIFSYSWNAGTKTLTHIGTFTLSGGQRYTYGLALDEINGLLYVGSGTPTVRSYDVNSGFLLTGSYNVPHNAIGIAVDASRGYFYTGAGFSYNNLLCRYDLSAGTYTTKVVGTSSRDGVMGVSVDPATGYVYCSTGYYSDTVVVLDNNMNILQRTGRIGNPTGIIVPGKDISYNPLALTKDDGLDDETECVAPENNITYTISYDSSLNTYDVDNATIVDTLPSDVAFVSASNGGTYNPVTREVTWNLGTISAGATGSVQLVVQVNPGVTAGSVIHNDCTIDSDQTPPTTQGDDTNVCSNQPPTADAGPDQTVEQTSTLGTDVTLDGSDSEDLDGDTLQYYWSWDGEIRATGVSPTATLPLGITTIYLKVEDGNGGQADDSVVITVQDTTPPDLAVPPAIVEEQTSFEGTPVEIQVNVGDICDAEVDVVNDAPAIFPLGETIVTFTATDDSGNQAIATTTVTIVDTTAPNLTVPEDVTVEQETLEGTEVELIATATDTCDADVEISSDAPAIFPLGETIVTFTATDDANNVATATTTVTVDDTVAPTITCDEGVNPHGNIIPGKERGNNGKPKPVNPDGFYELGSEDICDAEPEIWVGTAGDPMLFGPFPSGIVIKFTEAPGIEAPTCKKIGSNNGQADSVTWHITLPSEPVVTAIDDSGNEQVCDSCIVPPPPM